MKYKSQSKSKDALLIIDIQMDYFPHGACELSGSLEAAENAALLLQHFRKNKLPVLHIRNESIHKGATFLLPETPGVDFHPRVDPFAEEIIITKHFPNSFRSTELAATLQKWEISHIVVCGMMTHNCVSSTVREAWDRNFDISLIHDACATKELISPAGSISAEMVHNGHIAALSRFSQIFSTKEFLESET